MACLAFVSLNVTRWAGRAACYQLGVLLDLRT